MGASINWLTPSPIPPVKGRDAPEFVTNFRPEVLAGIEKKSLDGFSPLEGSGERLHRPDKWRWDTQFNGLSTNSVSPLF